MDEREIRRDGLPRASRFDLAACGDPECGPHIVAYDDNDHPLAEIVLSKEGGLALIVALQALLYQKVADAPD